MGVDGMADHLGDELVNQDDANVTTCQKAPGRRKMEEKIFLVSREYKKN